MWPSIHCAPPLRKMGDYVKSDVSYAWVQRAEMVLGHTSMYIYIYIYPLFGVVHKVNELILHRLFLKFQAKIIKKYVKASIREHPINSNNANTMFIS